MNEKTIIDMCNHTNLNPWYWISYGEKCYGFATVEAITAIDGDPYPEPGSELVPDNGSDNKWVGCNGVEMIIDEWIADSESQNGDTICRFIAGAHAELMKAHLPEK